MSERVICVGEGYISLLGAPLKRFGCKIIPIPANESVAPALRYHADLSVFFLNRDSAVIAPQFAGSILEKELTDAGISVIISQSQQGKEYPQDVTLCGCKIGESLCCNTATIDNFITNIFSNRIISVKQGYTKCAVSVVDERSIITSDAGIHKAACIAGIDSLLIEAGHLELTGYDTGFIGGCSGRIDNNIILSGRLDAHPDKAAIESFISSKGKNIIYLTDRAIFDVGSIITNEF